MEFAKKRFQMIDKVSANATFTEVRPAFHRGLMTEETKTMSGQDRFAYHKGFVRKGRRWLRQFIPMVFIAATVSAEDIQVTVTGIDDRKGGEIGIALYPGPSGFPMDSLKASCVWIKANATNITHSFRELKPGTYAVAVSHDLNGNHVTDTSWVGIPKEPWGVSKNIRPKMRAPRFEECSFSLSNSVPTSLVISVK